MVDGVVRPTCVKTPRREMMVMRVDTVDDVRGTRTDEMLACFMITASAGTSISSRYSIAEIIPETRLIW